MFRKYLVLLCCLFFAGERIAVAAVTAIEANGLTDKFITAITKDRQGLMWIGTHQGLYTYDGYEFVSLNTEPLSNSSISRLFYDKENDLLWIASDAGVFKLNCETRHTMPAGDTIWNRKHATGMALTEKGFLYISYNNGEVASAGPQTRLHLITTIEGNPQLKVADAGQTTTTLWINSGKTLYHISLQRDTVIQFMEQRSAPALIGGKRDILFVNSGGRLHMLNARSFEEIMPGIQTFGEVNMMTTLELRADTLVYILVRPSLLYAVNPLTGASRIISADAFTGRLSTCMFFDEQNIIWIGTNKGLLKVMPDETFFEQALIASPTISVRPLIKDEQGNFYAGTYSGFFRRGRDAAWKRTANIVPYAMANLPGRYVYASSDIRDFSRIDKRTGQVEFNFCQKAYQPEDLVGLTYCMMADKTGNLWLGGDYGLLSYDPVKNELTDKKINWREPTSSIVRYMAPANEESWWLATNKGLYLYNTKQQSLAWHISTQTRPALSLDMINFVTEDRQGQLWICTVGGGINILSRDRRSITVLKKENGLSDNTTYNLQWDQQGTAWIGTYNGLSRYDPQQKIFHNYYVTDGLSTNECNHNSCFKDSDGRMYFGTISGLNSFLPDRIPRTADRSTLFASSITKWNNSTHAISFIPTIDKDPIVLKPLDHSLSFSLAMTDYAHPENNRFEYRIKGLFDEWTMLNSEHTLRLDGLAPGNYLLEIKALDSRGIPAANMLNYRIEVLQSFYKAWWFYLLLVVLVSALVWAFYYLRLRQIHRMQTLKEQIASDLHDEVGSLLTRITMTSDSLLYTRHADDATASGLKKIASLSRTAVSSMSDVLWTIDARNDYTENLADRLREHAEEMLMPLGAEVHIDLKIAPRMSLPSGTRQQLYFIFKEAVNNIVKHSRPTFVTIRYLHNENGFELLIENDGMIGKSGSSKGQGLKNIAMRAKRIGAVAEIIPGEDRFRIQVNSC